VKRHFREIFSYIYTVYRVYMRYNMHAYLQYTPMKHIFSRYLIIQHQYTLNWIVFLDHIAIRCTNVHVCAHHALKLWSIWSHMHQLHGWIYACTELQDTNSTCNMNCLTRKITIVLYRHICTCTHLHIYAIQVKIIYIGWVVII